MSFFVRAPRRRKKKKSCSHHPYDVNLHTHPMPPLPLLSQLHSNTRNDLKLLKKSNKTRPAAPRKHRRRRTKEFSPFSVRDFAHQIKSVSVEQNPPSNPLLQHVFATNIAHPPPPNSDTTSPLFHYKSNFPHHILVYRRCPDECVHYTHTAEP